MRKVVVFVDEQAVLQTVTTVLAAQADFQVSVVSSEVETMQEIDASSILLTNLPASSDIKFLNSIRNDDATQSATPVVILTSSRNEQLAVQALREVAANYVPIRLIESELLDTVECVFAAASAHQSQSRIMECVTRWNNEFVLENDRTLIGPLVRYLQESTQRMGILCKPGEETRLGIALEEALLNSIYHGNLEVSSELKEEDDSEFYAQIEQHLVEKPYCDRHIRVQVSFSKDQAVFIIEDEGPGFDVTSVPDPTDPNNVERVCGRGMLLMRTFMDHVDYNDLGNQVTLVKRRQACDPS